MILIYYSMKKISVFCILLISVSTIFQGCTKSPENGVSLKLAKERKDGITNITYSLHFSIPKTRTGQINGKLEAIFSVTKKE